MRTVQFTRGKDGKFHVIHRCGTTVTELVRDTVEDLKKAVSEVRE